MQAGGEDQSVAASWPRLLSQHVSMLQVWICRCDAQLGTEVPGGTFVTVESGPHHGLLEGYRQLCRAPVKVCYQAWLPPV